MSKDKQRREPRKPKKSKIKVATKTTAIRPPLKPAVNPAPDHDAR